MKISVHLLRSPLAYKTLCFTSLDFEFKFQDVFHALEPSFYIENLLTVSYLKFVQTLNENLEIFIKIQQISREIPNMWKFEWDNKIELALLCISLSQKLFRKCTCGSYPGRIGSLDFGRFRKCLLPYHLRIVNVIFIPD